MVKEKIEFKEESEYGQENYTLNEIILRHIRKIADICCQELTGGYWNKKPIRTQSGIVFTEEYHPDLREAYCNAIDFLVDLIYPKGDKDLKAYIKKHDKDDDNEDGKDNKDDNDLIKEKIKRKRKIFKQINEMFERTNFFHSTDSSNE